jgi:hypothetical protein
VGTFSSMSFSSCCNLGFFVLSSLHLLLFSFSSYCPCVVICQKSLYYPPPFLFTGWEQLRVDNSANFFPSYIFFTSFVFSSCLLILFSFFLNLVCGARLVINYFGNKHKPFEKYFLQFCPCKCFESFLIVHRNY